MFFSGINQINRMFENIPSTMSKIRITLKSLYFVNIMMRLIFTMFWIVLLERLYVYLSEKGGEE